ncbi:glycosyltransferase family 2 protein [Natrinema halophilum]|uniref:Glycosyltransferase n=1 Tax=Natrinema halophilum TaxID=1699371 RepID=A0A7D5H6U2_9EURY|nr:glycosyltransferase family 2 protein [Natrinema halophilum]QLG48855.1 glycosyltransferase [Natrinema halophilum]
MSDPTVALGVKVFNRSEKLKTLLESVPADEYDTVYVADDGRTEERSHLYERTWPFDLELIDLPYDAGLGVGRNAIVDELSETYLTIVDSDHEVPANVAVLTQQLENRPEFGGISGLLLEHGTIQGLCHDLYENGDVLVRDTGSKTSETVAQYPLVEFDFVPNVATFRRACLEDRAWDENYVIGREHLDFFVAHHHETDWRFGTCPAVLFPHSPGGGSEYDTNRHDPAKHLASKSYFRTKWGYDQVIAREFWLGNQSVDTPLATFSGDIPVPTWLGAKVMKLRDARLRLAAATAGASNPLTEVIGR